MLRKNFNQSVNTDERTIQLTIKELQDLDYLDDKTIKYIEDVFRQFNDKLITFEDYEKILSLNDTLINLVDSLIADQTPNSEEVEVEVEDSSIKLFSLLFMLKDLASKVAYSKIIGFMRDILNNPNRKEILFNYVDTEEEINKRYRKLALYFHPDKTSGLCIPNVLKEDYKSLGIQLFKYVLEFKNSLLFDLEKSSKIGGPTIHEEKALELWKIAIDYRNAHKEQWNKLKVLKKEDLRILTSEELKNASIDNGLLAYEEYRAACKIADKNKQLKSQIKLRGYMALSLHISNRSLEAQLCAISAINLIFRNSTNVTRQELFEAKQVLDKVKVSNSSESENTPQLKTEINTKYSPDSPCYADVIVKTETMCDEYSFFEKKAIYRSINEDLENISIELMLKADRSLVSYQTSRKDILQAKTHANMFIATGISTMAVGGVAGGLTAATALTGAVQALVVGSGIGGPVLGVCAGVSMLIFGLWGGHTMWKRGAKLLVEPKTREALNEIMKNAVDYYDKEKYQKFFDELSKNYESDSSILKLVRRGDSIDHRGIIRELIKHGYRPDGIAYLLNLIGEVFMSGKIKIKGITTEELKTQGSNVLNGVLDEELIYEAKKLDGRCQQLRKRSMTSLIHQFVDFLRLRDYSRTAYKYNSEYEDDMEEMPFTSKLEEMRNTARINLAIRDILNGGLEEIERAKQDVEEIRKSTESHRQFIGMAKIRLEVLEDFLWVISGDVSDKLDFPEIKDY